MNRENDDSIIKAVGVDLNAMLNDMPDADRNNILDDSAKQAQQLLGIYENGNMEKASVASVFEEQDIVLPSGNRDEGLYLPRSYDVLINP
ncbi:hypothetical protein SNE40_019976 [Patella caerulea]|uniref:Uncharacterized protein n=1 Tax=Patella caerulea TaxID=87958 RepID=A0AAN8J116_PATCE